MANSPTESDPIDRLSNLTEALLITIISFLPTHIAARTSVLCRRFHHLWEASPSLALMSQGLPRPKSENFVAMAKHALLGRNPSHSVLSLHLEVFSFYHNASFLSSLFSKARSLDLRYLTFVGCHSSNVLPILPIIFTINSLRNLCLDRILFHANFQEFIPIEITLTYLKSLSLRLFFFIDMTKVNSFLSKLCSLEVLQLELMATPWLNLSSQTIRKLKLIIESETSTLDIVLSLPSLDSLHLVIRYGLQSLSHIHGEVPLLRKAVINLHGLHERDVSAVTQLLNCISHVEELSMHINESSDVKYPFSLLESGKELPIFFNLKHLDVILCFHKYNFEAVTIMLHNCPVLESLKLVHQISCSTFSRRRGQRKYCRSKLPVNADVLSLGLQCAYNKEGIHISDIQLPNLAARIVLRHHLLICI